MHSVNPDKLKPLAAESPGKGGPDAEWIAGLQRAPMPIDEKLFRHIGKPVERKEDQRLLTGKGRFSDDFSLPGQTYAAVVRSPHPHARILSIAKEEALACPGVLLVLTGKDCLADGLGPIPHSPVPSTRYDMKLAAPGGGKPFFGPELFPARRQDPFRRRAGGDGDRGNRGAGRRRRRARRRRV